MLCSHSTGEATYDHPGKTPKSFSALSSDEELTAANIMHRLASCRIMFAGNITPAHINWNVVLNPTVYMLPLPSHILRKASGVQGSQTLQSFSGGGALPREPPDWLIMLVVDPIGMPGAKGEGHRAQGQGHTRIHISPIVSCTLHTKPSAQRSTGSR